MKKVKKRKTLGKMSNSRAVWEINPVTRVKESKGRFQKRSDVKQKLKQGKWEQV